MPDDHDDPKVIDGGARLLARHQARDWTHALELVGDAVARGCGPDFVLERVTFESASYRPDGRSGGRRVGVKLVWRRRDVRRQPQAAGRAAELEARAQGGRDPYSGD